MKKGQSALEYLTTYGWVIIIILLAGAALFAMGILSPTTYTKRGCVGFNHLEYREHAFLDNGDFIIKFANGSGAKIQVNATRITVEGTTRSNTYEYPVNAGDSEIITVTGFTGFQEGDHYIATVKFEFSTIGGIQQRQEIGECTGRVE